VVGLYRVFVGVSELAACIVFFDGRRIFYAMQSLVYQPGKITVTAISFLLPIFHSPSLNSEPPYKTQALYNWLNVRI
jgi:hypothetical protein